MKRLLTIAAALLLAIGCSSTPPQQNEQKRLVAKDEIATLFDQHNAKAQLITPSTNGSYIKQHEQLGKVLGVQQYELTSDFGKFYAISKTGYNFWPPLEHPFYITAEKLFDQSCAGETYKATSFEEADLKGLLNPLLYATANEVELMKKHTVSTLMRTKDYDRHAQYLRLSTRDQPKSERRNYSVTTFGNYSLFFLKNIDFSNSEINIPTASIETQYPATKACYENGKITGYQIVFRSYVNAGDNNYITPAEDSHTLTIYYIPAGTADTFAKQAFQQRRDNLSRQLARVQKEEEKRLAYQRAIEVNDLAGANNWAQRLDKPLTPGDKVCSPDNKMGFVEQANGKNIKVWFKGKLTGQNQNYFFGNSKTHPDRSFRYQNINDLIWVKRGDVATCNFKLNIS